MADLVAAAERIHKAIQGLGTDDAALVHEVTSHTNEQLFKINLEYQKKYEKNLYEDIKGDTSGDYRDLLVALVMPIADYRAYVVRNAIRGAGTDEDALIDVFAPATKQEIADLKSSYEFTTGKILEKELADDLSGNFEKGILSLLHGFREPGANPAQAARDADEIYKKGEGKWGTDDAFFVKFFTTHSYEHLALVDAAYSNRYGHNLRTAIEKETSGYYKKLLQACVTQREVFYATRIHEAIKGLGTKDKVLIRIFALNNKREHLVNLKRVYQELFKESLVDAISGDTSGWYKKTFLGVLDRAV
jgi:annexin A7/11